jgi:hypothetical protein
MRVSKIVAVAGLAVVATGFAWADTPLPHQRPGLWQGSITSMGHTNTTMYCMDAASEAKQTLIGEEAQKRNCTANQRTHNMDGSWDSSSTCKFGPGPARTTRSHTTGDFNSKVTIVMFAGNTNTPESTITMTWLGACKPGMRPGDVIMSDGTKMNVMDGSMSGGPPH